MTHLLGDVLAAYAIWQAWRRRRQREPITGLQRELDVPRMQRRDAVTLMLRRMDIADPEAWLS